ncbi:MAG TPA: Hsp20/alpha crystallin family protein [Phycisphaerae bacterium]|nr:Hsp20/alpha crystallin family protein [Phycisphaerae bacterium]
MAGNTMQTCEAPKRATETVPTERIRGGRTYLPAVDIVERDDRLMLVADMPGVRRDDLEIVYERGQLSILGKVSPRQTADGVECLRCEYGVGDFARVFQVGEGIDASKIEAELRDGVLTVHLPKARELMPRRIAVKSQ